MCGEFALKAALAYGGVIPPSTHNHSLLKSECGRHGIKVPKSFSAACEVLTEYEAMCRYDTSYILDDDEYLEIRDTCKKYLDIISVDIYADAADLLRSKAPSGLSDAEIADMCWRQLPEDK